MKNTDTRPTLPKQWRHWCKVNKLHTMGRSKKSKDYYAWFCLVGRGHVWRLNCYDMLQCGDTYAEFDRWALCDIYEEKCPTTLAEFTQFVKRSLDFKKMKEQE